MATESIETVSLRRSDAFAPFHWDELSNEKPDELVRRIRAEQEAEKEKIESIKRRFHDFTWYSQFLLIQEKLSHTIVPLKSNTIQQKILDEIHNIERQRRAVRLIILKSRRMGCSTIIQGLFTHRACTRLNFSGLTVADELDNSKYLHEMSSRMYDGIPSALKPRAEINQRGREMKFSNGSSLSTETAQSPDAGRSTARMALHLSEVAFWPYTSKTLLALRQVVPETFGSFIILESTANGVGDHFHSEWQQAVDGDNDYVPLFYGWNEFPGNRRTVPAVLLDGEGRLELIDDGYEVELREDDVDDEQIYWRRWSIKNNAGGDLLLFQQEYPYTADEAFIVSGRPFFGQSIKSFKPVDPIRIGDLNGDCKRGSPISFIDDANGYLKIYEIPQPSTRYVIFADPSGILTDDQYNAFDKKAEAHDFCAITVVNCRTGAIAATYRRRIDNDLFGYEIFKVGRLYNRGIVAVEVTGGYGLQPLSILNKKLNYENLYYRQNWDDTSHKWTRSLGWMTTKQTKALMLDALKETLRDTPHKLKDKMLKSEMLKYIIHSNATVGAAPGYNDDMVMSAAGGLLLAQEFAQSVNGFKEPPPEKSRFQQ
jgi:hypothetical protein